MFAAKNELLTRPSGGFVIPRSLRFRASASAYLTRTVASTSDRQKATWSGWVKRGAIDATARGLWAGDDGAGNRDLIRFNTTEKLAIFLNEGTGATLVTTQVFRDPSAWYHFIIAIDTTQATAANRIKLYVNGTQVTAFDTATYPSQNANFVAWNVSGKVQDVGDSSPPGAGQFFDGYMAEVNWIDGQQLTPTSFGATSTTTGVWSPINYGGSYGTNGYHLTFNSYATTAALGTDTSGNSNTWTVNNCSVTAGVTYDSMIDVPTVTDTGSNYAVMNPLFAPTSGSNVITNGNLLVTGGSAGANNRARSTFSIASGKYYWEISIPTTGSGSGDQDYGVIITASSNTGISTSSAETNYGSSGNVYKNGVSWSYGTPVTWTINDVMGCAYDFSAGTVSFYKNNTLVTTVTGLDSSPRQPYCTLYTTNDEMNFNFGQRPFSYTPPSGYTALNTYNLAAPSILKGNLYMDATTYTGTGASLGVTNAGGFQPDWVWTKSRSAATDNKLTDSVRGVTKALISNSAGAETTDSQGLTAFNTGGFTVGTNTDYNNLAATYVGWQWKGGGAAVSNTSGSITSSVSASATSGFSVVTYTGNGSNGASIGHGLGVTPQLVLFKDRSGAVAWIVYHVSLGSNTYLTLNNTTAGATATGFCTPSSSLITFTTTYGNTNSSGDTYVAYCFTPIAGFSAFGSYAGNGSADGSFVYCGFRPKWILLKRAADATALHDWRIFDTARDTYNLSGQKLYPSLAQVEDPAGDNDIDILSNGFKLRTVNGGTNALIGTMYIYAAFAENPFNNSLAR